MPTYFRHSEGITIQLSEELKTRGCSVVRIYNSTGLYVYESRDDLTLGKSACGHAGFDFFIAVYS